MSVYAIAQLWIHDPETLRAIRGAVYGCFQKLQRARAGGGRKSGDHRGSVGRAIRWSSGFVSG